MVEIKEEPGTGKMLKRRGKKNRDSRILNFPFQLKSKNKTFVIHPS